MNANVCTEHCSSIWIKIPHSYEHYIAVTHYQWHDILATLAVDACNKASISCYLFFSMTLLVRPWGRVL